MRRQAPVTLWTILREWGRIGCIGFGGPPTHIALLRQIVVERQGWIDPGEFEHGVAACGLLPGPASTQLCIYCAWRLRGWLGALVGGLAFVVPGMVAIVALAGLFLATAPPSWVRGAGLGAGAAVAAVAVEAGLSLAGPSLSGAAVRSRWWMYLLAGGVAAASVGPYLVLVLIGCGAIEVALRRRTTDGALVLSPLLVATTGGLGSLAWVAFKVGALSYGGGFVIVPLMQHDAVNRYHWMTAGQFLNAVALGQITPGPVVHTVTAVGYAADGVTGAVLAAAIAFTPSFVFVLVGGPHFDRLRESFAAQSFLAGAGPAAVGAILGSAVPLARAISHPWQAAVLAAAAVLLLALRRGVVLTLAAAAAVGAVIALAGGPVH
jgi:chromate transporter